MAKIENRNLETRSKIFRQELSSLKEKGYVTPETIATVEDAYEQFHSERMIEAKSLDAIKTQAKETERNIQKTQPKPRPQKVIKVRTPEEIRERNITWSLNLGVILLLIGGMVVATSNWASMTSIMKSVSIAAVALLFYGFAYLSKKVLRIDKTAFAFIVLGSLFLPIFVLSLGWFGLLGNYLSVTGEGKYFLGVLGSFLPIGAYIYFARTLASRLFVWFTYISVSVGIGFFLAGLNLGIDYFYLGMVVYNAILVSGYFFLKKKDRFKIFLKELIVFAQVNLVLATVSMIFIYDVHIINSFNILLTAVIYLSMMFVTGKKEYHFIFTVMIVYGAYQLIEHSILDAIGPILYACIGIGFLFIPSGKNLSDALRGIFQITSAVVSVLAFVYISLEGLFLKMGESSIVLAIAYFIIASHFIALSHLGKRKVFPYLSSVFYGASFLEWLEIIDDKIFIPIVLEVYISGFILFIAFGALRILSKLDVIRYSSRDIGLVMMGGAILFSADFSQWWELSAMLVGFTLIAYLLFKLEKRSFYHEISGWILPISLGLAFVAMGEEIRMTSIEFQENFGLAAGFFSSSIVLYLTSLIWRNFGEQELERNSFYIVQALYSLAILISFISPIDDLFIRPLVVFGGIFVYLLLFKKTRNVGVPYIISFTTLLFYFSVLISIHLQIEIPYGVEPFIYTGAGIFLLIVAVILIKKSAPLCKSFAWLGHVIYFLSLVFVFFEYMKDSILSIGLSIFIYAFSLFLVNQKVSWERYVFLYALFGAVFGTVVSGLASVNESYPGYYSFLITSGVIAWFWLFCNEFYKKTTMLFWVPFSILGILSCIYSYPFTETLFILTIFYIGVVLFFLHWSKWESVSAIPLILLFISTVEFTMVNEWEPIGEFSLISGMGVVLLIIGRLIFPKLFMYQVKKWPVVDYYSIVSFLFFLYLMTFDFTPFWLEAFPGFLMALGIYLQQTRVAMKSTFLVKPFSGLFLLQAYYSYVLQLTLPSLWEREILVLPWMVFVIFLRRTMVGQFVKVTGGLQWAVLVIVSLLLIQDGMASSTIYDALILGSLSLISLLSGMFLRVKSYFIVGSGVLLLNVFLQTRPFWGNMPWWAYLLIAGSILIFVASYNEWQKQKHAKGEKTFLGIWKERLVQTWKKWD